MGKRIRPKRSDSFESEVHRQFGALAAGWGLQGPIEEGILLPTVTYRGDRLSYSWKLNDEDLALSVGISLVVAEGKLAIDLEDLIAGAGLGSRQHVRTSARTWHALQQSIVSHVDWLNRLHSLLTRPEAEGFLAHAGACRIAPDP